MSKLIKKRDNAQVGIIEIELAPEHSTAIHFSEWWNGEGLDFQIMDDTGETKFFTLHLQELEALTAAGLSCGMVSLKEVKRLAKELGNES